MSRHNDSSVEPRIPWDVHIRRRWHSRGWLVIRGTGKLRWFPSYNQARRWAERLT